MSTMNTWPPSIRTTDLVFTVVRDATGDPLPTVVTIRPEFGGPPRIVHESGATLTAEPDQALIRAGQERRIALPVVDQDGWEDPSGNPFSRWSYTVTAVIGLGANRFTVVHHLQPLNGQGDIVLAKEPVDNQPGEPTNPQPTGGLEVVFAEPLATWTVPHALGRRPSVSLYDEHGVAMDSDVEATPTLAVVTFPVPTAGSVVLA